MKKILLTIFTIILILSINVLAVDIDIGVPAIDRDASWTDKYTIINVENPANETGKITSIEIWAYEAMTSICVGTFYVVSGNTLACRDQDQIANVPAGSKQTFEIDINVVAGDYIGISYESGRIEFDTSGGNGVWQKSSYGPWIIDQGVAYGLYPTYVASLYGIGTTVVGWAHKWNTQTISKWNTKEFTKWNGLE